MNVLRVYDSPHFKKKLHLKHHCRFRIFQLYSLQMKNLYLNYKCALEESILVDPFCSIEGIRRTVSKY